MDSAIETSKEYHDKLAGIIKGAHANLRHKYRTCGGDFEKVWSEHCQDDVLLSQYAEAMYHLANDVWTKHPKTRIDWCRETCVKYFHGGGLEKVLDKEKRRAAFETQKASAKLTCRRKEPDISNDISTENPRLETECEGVGCSEKDIVAALETENAQITASDSEYCQKVAQTDPHKTRTSHEVGPQNESSVNDETENRKYESCSGISLQAGAGQQDYITVLLPFDEQIRLLDVGSCYNAFSEFKDFIAIGIDLSPAVPTVLRCDFLNVKIDGSAIKNQSSFEEFKTNLSCSIDGLPQNSFHVVVFSLLLEYFPSPLQRWRCCEKARELLMLNGLLLIITPDSHHQNKNAPMMKSWKRAIESMGFKRFCYEKEEHLHCMAFRKVVSNLNSPEYPSGADRDPNLLYIPQDFTNDAIKKVTSHEATVGDNSSTQETKYDETLMQEFGDVVNCFDD